MFSQRRANSLAACVCFICLSLHSVWPQEMATSKKRPVDYVNGLVGTAPLDKQKLIGNAPPPGEKLYAGFTSPGAVLPHGSTIFAPINRNQALSYSTEVETPYYYPNRTIIGFSSGSQDGPTVMPVVGDWTVPPERISSVYDKAQEKSSPGYYSVFLNDFNIRAEMTVTTWTGLYRFTFPATKRAHILLDLNRLGGTVEVMNDHSVRGQMPCAGNGHIGVNPDDAYFVAEFSRPFVSFGTFREIPPAKEDLRRPMIGKSEVKAGAQSISGRYAGAYLQFVTTAGEQILVRIASGRSYAVAEQRLHSEDPDWNFKRIRTQAEEAWAKKINLIQVKGGTEKEKTLFYSCLYLAFSSPQLIARKGEQFTGHDGVVETAAYDRYGPVPLWDTGRNQVVLLTLLEPQVKLDILRSELDAAREDGYMETSFHGDHAVLMYLGDWQRGIDFDWAAVYPYLRKNAMDVNGPRPYLGEYLKHGWISDVIPASNPLYADGKSGVANTLEYSWDDAALAIYAEKLGKTADYHMFLKRAYNYQNLFDRSIGFMRGKTADGQWVSPFDPREPYYNFMWKEASGWSTLWLVPQDIPGLIHLLGGREQFAAKLDEFFDTPYRPKGICEDCTGVVGQYVQGNQPDQQAAYYYDWAGQPWKTQALVRRILEQMYGSDRTGYAFPGMDDQGSMSSWYVLSAMGFYTVDPSSPNYILGSPIFNQIAIHMGNGKTFMVEARHNSEKNIYIQSAYLNGKPWDKPWFRQADIANGGTLVLNMGPLPNKQWGSAPDAAPPSMLPPH